MDAQHAAAGRPAELVDVSSVASVDQQQAVRVGASVSLSSAPSQPPVRGADMSIAVIATLVLATGICLGISGYGSFLVPAILASVLHMDPRDAVAHGMLCFILPGALAAYLYWRADTRPSWSITLLLCAGTVPGVLAGRTLSGALSSASLEFLLATLVLLAGCWLLVQQRFRLPHHGPPTRSPVLSAGVVGGAGLLGGAASVLTGVGGPLITVPILVAFGFEVKAVVGAAILNAVLVSILAAGSLLNVVTIDTGLLVVISTAQLVGITIGVWIQRRVEPIRLVRLISLASVAVGIGLILKGFA